MKSLLLFSLLVFTLFAGHLTPDEVNHYYENHYRGEVKKLVSLSSLSEEVMTRDRYLLNLKVEKLLNHPLVTSIEVRSTHDEDVVIAAAGKRSESDISVTAEILTDPEKLGIEQKVGALLLTVDPNHWETITRKHFRGFDSTAEYASPRIDKEKLQEIVNSLAVSEQLRRNGASADVISKEEKRSVKKTERSRLSPLWYNLLVELVARDFDQIGFSFEGEPIVSKSASLMVTLNHIVPAMQSNIDPAPLLIAMHLSEERKGSAAFLVEYLAAVSPMMIMSFDFYSLKKMAQDAMRIEGVSSVQFLNEQGKVLVDTSLGSAAQPFKVEAEIVTDSLHLGMARPVGTVGVTVDPGSPVENLPQAEIPTVGCLSMEELMDSLPKMFEEMKPLFAMMEKELGGVEHSEEKRISRRRSVLRGDSLAHVTEQLKRIVVITDSLSRLAQMHSYFFRDLDDFSFRQGQNNELQQRSEGAVYAIHDSVSEIADVAEKRLRESEIKAAETVRSELEAYWNAYLYVVDLQIQYGVSRNDGLQGYFRMATHQLAKALKNDSTFSQELSLQVQFLQLRKYEKEYLLTKEKRFAERHARLLGELMGMYTVMNPQIGFKKEVDLYESAFKSMVASSLELGEAINKVESRFNLLQQSVRELKESVVQ